MRNVLDKFVQKKGKKIIFKNFFRNRAVYELIFKKMVLPDRPQMTIQ